MKKPPAYRLLSFLLVCALLGQWTLGIANGYCLDVSQAVADSHSDHSHSDHGVMEVHSIEEPDALGEHHHHRCCHTTPSNIAVPVAPLALFQSITISLTPLFSADPYRDPLADLLIRPPIA